MLPRHRALCRNWIRQKRRDIERFLLVRSARRFVRIGDFGTPMAARRTGLDLPLPLQFLAAWLSVWLGRVLQEQVEYLRLMLADWSLDRCADYFSSCILLVSGSN